MKTQADKKRSDRVFAVGDFVYLKLQPYIQSSVAPRAHKKLSHRYFGAYKVLERIGSVAYKLELPASSSVHPVFHVSLLKPASSTNIAVSSSLPDVDDSLQVPEPVLQHCLHHCSLDTVPQVYIKWSGLDTSLATWEDEEALRQWFPGSCRCPRGRGCHHTTSQPNTREGRPKAQQESPNQELPCEWPRMGLYPMRR
jgi:hypothetical protein